MRWNISSYDVTWGAEGQPQVRLYAGKAQVATVQFADAPQQRFTVDPETRVVDLEITTAEREYFMDLLRHERFVVIDTEAPALVFRR